MPRILDDLNEDPEFQALSPAAKTAVMQAAKRGPLVTPQAVDPAPPKRTRSVVEREPAPDPLDAYLPKKPPVPKAVSAKFKRSKEQDAVDQLAEDSRNRRIGMTGPALTAERLRENLAGAALQGAKDMGNPVQLGAEALGAALARPALDAIAEDDERKRPAIERAADRSPAARRIQPNYRPKDTIEHVAEFLQPIEDAGRQIAADPADALDPTRPGTAEGQAAFLGATGANLVDPIGDGAIGLAAKGAGKLAKGAASAIDPRARIASRIADAARAAERTGADLGDVGRVDPATQSGVLLDDGTPQKSWPERLDNLGQQTARRARGSVMKRGVTADNAESVMVERTRMMDDANRMQDTARSLLAGPERPAPATPLSPENYAPDGQLSPRTQRIAGDLRESIEQVEAAKRRPAPPAVTNMFAKAQPEAPAPNPAGGSSLDEARAAYDTLKQARNAAVDQGAPDQVIDDLHAKLNVAYKAWRDLVPQQMPAVEQVRAVPAAPQPNGGPSFDAPDRRTPTPRTPQVDTPDVIPAGPIQRPFNYVTDPEAINGKTWYHGTGTPGLTGGDLRPSATKIEGLFGQGIYLTDNPDIAGGYAVSRGRKSTPHIYEAGVKINRVLDLEQPAAQDFLDVLKERAGNLAGYGDEGLVAALDDLATRPGATNQDLYRTFSEGVSDFSHSEGVSTAELEEDFHMLNEGLRQRGYDAYTHTGGQRTGRAPHQVLIMLDPNGELGAFRPGDPLPPSQMTRFAPWDGVDPTVRQAQQVAPPDQRAGDWQEFRRNYVEPKPEFGRNEAGDELMNNLRKRAALERDQREIEESGRDLLYSEGEAAEQYSTTPPSGALSETRRYRIPGKGVIEISMGDRYLPTHVSNLYIDPKHRNGRVLLSLLKRVRKDVGEFAVDADNLSPQMAALIATHDVPVRLFKADPSNFDRPWRYADEEYNRTAQETGGGPFLRRLASEERGEFDINKLVPQPKRAGKSGGMTDPKDQPAIDADLSRMFREQAPSDGIVRMARDAAAGNRDAMRALEAERTRLAYEMDMPAPGSPELGAAMRAYSKFEREVFEPAQESYWNVPAEKKTTYGADPASEMGGASSQADATAARTRETEGLLTVARWDLDNIEERIDGFWAEQREQDGYDGITRDRDGTLAELRRNREFRDLEAQQQEIATYMRSLEADLAGPAGPSTPEPAGAFDLPSLGRLASEEDGAFRPGAIGDTLRRLFGRDKAPIPAPQAAVGSPRVNEPAPAPADTGMTLDSRPVRRAAIPLDDINLDPQTYQFKASDAVTGRNARFDGEESWRPDNLTQKPIIVHRRLDGRLFVADGHQRVNLARTLRAQGQDIPPLQATVMDEADGWTPDLVMRKASLMNLDEGTGNALDVARLIAKGGMTPEQVAGLAKSSAAVRDGRTLSTLDDEALTFVANQDIKPSVAAAAAQATDDPAMRMVILREIAEDRPATAGEAALLARDVIETGISQARPADQLAMFDLSQYSKSNRKTLYKVVNALKTALKGDESLGNLLTARADEIKRVEGNALNDEANTLLKTEAGALQYMLEREAGAVGPFREALKALAAEVDRGQVTLSQAVARARQALADAGPAAAPGGDAVRVDAQPRAVAPTAGGGPVGPLPDTDLFGNPVGAPEPAAVAPAAPEPFAPPASTPEAGGPVVGRPRADLARPASPTDQKALDDAYRMRDRFVRSGNQRAVDEFQTRIDAIEAKYAAAPPPPPQSAKQLQGRLNMLKRHLREARAAGNSQRAGELSAQVDEIDGILNGSARWPDREPGVPLEDRSPRARANEREALQQQDLTKARRIDDGIHKRMHNLPGDPDNIAASIFENFRVNGGSPEESAILAEGVRRVMARADWNPHARVPFADVLQEAAETDPALVEELIRRGVPKDQMIPVQMQTALRQRQGQLQSFIADLRKEEERAILGQDIEGAQELGNAIQKAERDLDAILEITVPMGSKYARALRMEGLTAKREGFDTTFWMARVRRNATGDTMRPAPPKIERRVKEATSKGNEAKATKANALEQLRAMGIDTAALEAPATVESVMRESGLTRFMGKLKDWGMTARPGAIFPARMPGSATTPAVTKRQPPPMPDLSHLTPEQRATAEMLWREAADARIAEREAQVELTRTAADARMTTIPEAITNTRRAFLIAGVKTFERNILSNLSNIPLEGASKAIAAVPDRALSMLGLTKEPGARTIRLRQFQDVGSAMKTSVPQGFKEWGEILRHGQTAEDIARQEVVVEQNTGFPAWDGVVNIVFRNQAGADRPTYLYGYARSLQRQAWNLFPNDEAARRAFIANPPEAVANEALADAAFGVYQNDTTMNQALQGLGSTLRRGGTGGRGLAWVYDNLGALYKKTPSAVATRTTVDFTPIGAAARVLDALWENGLQKLNPEAQKAVTMAIGRGAVGTGVIATGWALAGQGAMTGYYRPDFKEEILTSGRTPGSIYFKGEWVPLQWLGPVGHLLAIGATLREAGAGTVLPFSDMGNWPTMAATGAGAAMQSVVDSPMAQSAKQMQEIMQPDERTAYQKGNKLAGSFVQGFIPSVINEFARARDTQADGYGRRRAVDDTSTTGAMVDSLKSRIPGLRETLPMAVDDLGREVREPGGAGAFMAWSGRPSEESQDRVVRAIIETGADLRGAQSSLRDAGGRGRADDVSIRLDPAQERDYRSTRGQAIYAEVAKALDSQAYQDAMRIGDPDRLRELVQDAIGRGSKSGTKAYRAREGSTIKDGRARALAEKDRRRDVRALPAAPWWDEPSATVPPALRGRTSTPASP